MRNNGPVTQRERTFDSSQRLVSTTDLKGRITHCNDAFVEISGFAREELIGESHNIVRHPDMPPVAFQVMWSYLKQGRPWMGLVKNRSKNGDHYWVDAYVTPISEHGTIVGYESVRSKPARRDVERAEKLYRDIFKRGFRERRYRLRAQDGVGLVGLLAGVGLMLAGNSLPGALVLAATGVVIGLMGRLQMRQMIATLNEKLPNAFSHPVAVETYTDETGLRGRLEVAMKSEQARMITVITRIEDASDGVSRQSSLGMDLSQRAKEEIARQQQETEQVAAAMHEMSTTINDVSEHVERTADEASR
ncbi:MAG: PAS domain-containing protein, partial [Marinobacter sp.]|nr:PAS domain-containing protein [Marinobacter sp.]